MKKLCLIILLVAFFITIEGIFSTQPLLAISSDTQVSLEVSDGTATPTPTPIVTSNTTTFSSASTPACGNNVTSGTPDLFEIRTNKNTATLFFAPPTAPYSSFYIAYSRKADSWEYGVEYNQNYSGGVLNYTINMLQPNTKYYFKLRAGNGCAAGNWGNTLSASTTKSTTLKTYYKNIFTAIIQQTKTILNRLIQNKMTTTKKDTTQPQQIIPSPTPKPEPIITTAPRKKFCILWWCF